MTYAGFPSKGVCVGNPACLQTHKNTTSVALRNPVARNTCDRETACVKRKRVWGENKQTALLKLIWPRNRFLFFFHIIKLVVPFWFRNTGTLYFMASMKMTWLGIVQHEWKKEKGEGEGRAGRRGGGRQIQWGEETPFPPISTVSYDVTVLSREDSWPKTMNSS